MGRYHPLVSNLSIWNDVNKLHLSTTESTKRDIFKKATICYKQLRIGRQRLSECSSGINERTGDGRNRLCWETWRVSDQPAVMTDLTPITCVCVCVCVCVGGGADIHVT